MIVNKLSLGANSTTVHQADRIRPARDREHARTAPAAEVERGRERRVRERYSIDQFYRADLRKSATSERRDVGGSNTGLRKISSADLLNSMIHRMGGAPDSSSKGTFVDFVI